MKDNAFQWCIHCGARFTEEEIANLTCCPKCGNDSIPCAADQDWKLEINWQELRVLCNWAMFWADHKNIEDSCIPAIVRRLQQQVPKGTTPLTIHGELMEIKKDYKVETNLKSPQPFQAEGPGAVGRSVEPMKKSEEIIMDELKEAKEIIKPIAYECGVAGQELNSCLNKLSEDIYSDDKCIFGYCPHPEICKKNGCGHPQH